ncbi:uncharacterized protein F5891DRAFT_1196359 [Suillus fuscotomentosus]|uniref:Uncharacterized protein n=1 Tax=Suillus fuscotomentosus TaxID=1912939 RepID=A0AAD4DVR6_9AGAM|nr:uncharacterized protein F5891DRAFT_1196359 [Suillus fuscotomentosus]KAG1893508.1 hypothetical protein F5891DRAFT_1196359 [Suillus fuscotomentosus]
MVKGRIFVIETCESLQRLDAHATVQAANLKAVYVDSDQYPTVSHTSLIVPTGWKQVAVYTDQDLVTRKVFQVDPTSTLFSSNHSSSASVFEENELFMSTMSSLSEGHWMSDVNSLVLDAPSNPAASASGNIPDRTTFLDSEVIPSTIAATNNTLSPTHYQQGAVYVSCSPQIFTKGITYDHDFLQKHFCNAYVTISDAKILAKNYLCSRPHVPIGQFKTYCTQAIVEMLTVAASVGQAVELGFRCSKTGHTKQLNLQIDAVSLVSNERKAFMKSIKTFAISFVDYPDRERLGGYNIQNIDVTTTEYIKMLTGLTSANSVVTSIAFTCDNQGRPYCRWIIIVLLTHRLLRPIQNRSDSLLDLFLDDYHTFLEHLLSLVMVLRTRFPGEVPNNFAKEAFMDEEARQLALFRSFRNSGVPQAIELNTWLTTPNGWRHDL